MCLGGVSVGVTYLQSVFTYINILWLLFYGVKFVGLKMQVCKNDKYQLYLIAGLIIAGGGN